MPPPHQTSCGKALPVKALLNHRMQYGVNGLESHEVNVIAQASDQMWFFTTILSRGQLWGNPLCRGDLRSTPLPSGQLRTISISLSLLCNMLGVAAGNSRPGCHSRIQP